MSSVTLLYFVGLGFSIAGGKGTEHIPDDDGIFVTKIIPGGAASEDGTLIVGDRIVKVNEHSMVGVTHVQAVDILRSTSHRVELHYERTSGNQVPSSGPRVFKFDGVPEQKADKSSHYEITPYQQRVVNFERPEGKYLFANGEFLHTYLHEHTHTLTCTATRRNVLQNI